MDPGARTAPKDLATCKHRWGAACLAVCSADAARLAAAPALATFRGAPLRVLRAEASAAAADERMSAAAREAVLALEASLAAALGGNGGGGNGGGLPAEVRHVLRCCPRATAAAAVEETVRTLRSGKVKKPLGLALQARPLRCWPAPTAQHPHPAAARLLRPACHPTRPADPALPRAAGASQGKARRRGRAVAGRVQRAAVA